MKYSLFYSLNKLKKIMKIKFNKDELLLRLKNCAAFIPKKASLPAYEMMLFRVTRDIATITSGDGEKQISTWLNHVKSEGDSIFCIPGKLLLNTLNLMLEQEVVFTVKEKTVELKCGKAKYRFENLEPSVYPLMPNISSEFEASFMGHSFNEAIEIAKAYANPESTVPAQQGITLRLNEENKIVVFGFGRFEIAKIVVTPRSINKWADILIPVQAVNAINKCISDGDIVDITHNKDKVEVKTDDVSIVAIAFNVSPPDYDKFFKNKYSNFIELNTFHTLTALQRIKGFVTEELSRIKINIGKEETIITAIDDRYNREGEEVIDVKAETEFIFAINVEFMIRVLSSFTNDNFRLLYKEGNNPIHIEPVNTIKENDKFFLISPMNQN